MSAQTYDGFMGDALDTVHGTAGSHPNSMSASDSSLRAVGNAAYRPRCRKREARSR
jgi:hypothetical protein